jgi:methyltransferase-like protein/SAM-dependent methyltransferase
MSIQTAATSYDIVPYDSHPFPQTHPDRLATIATLLGLEPIPVDRCRVLELGCAAGGNLLPMAQSLPGSFFVGVDLSSKQIADGQRVIRAVGLSNVELKHISILDITPDFGRFDYIICHGVFSWVPRAVQDHILAVAARHLTRNGIAYVSYNTYPGWHMRGMIRDMMLYHARQFSEPKVRVQQSRNLLDFLVRSVTGENTPFSLLLKSEVEVLRNSRDYYLFHEHLEECNEPIYFHQFVERAVAHGLRYLGEVELHVMVPGNYPPEIANVLQMLSPDLIHMEQYMDFLRNRMFRQTLLCAPHCVPNYSLRPDRLMGFQVASAAQPVSDEPDVRSAAAEEFRTTSGVSLTSTDPVAKAAMVHLARVWPQTMPFEQLLTAACQRAEMPLKTPEQQAEAAERLGRCLLACYTSASPGLVELHLCPPKVCRTASERPAATPLARFQTNLGAQVANLRHELVNLSEFGRHVVRHLDGNRDRAALLALLTKLVAEGQLAVMEHGQSVEDADRLGDILAKALDKELAQLGRHSLLME